MKNKVGRPVKYKNDEERKETRKIQNRLNQRACRKRRELIQLNEFKQLKLIKPKKED